MLIRDTAITPIKLEKQTLRYCNLMSTVLWASCPEQSWQLASEAHCAGTPVADPPSGPATKDISTDAVITSQQFIQISYITHKHMPFIHQCCHTNVKQKFFQF
jgi:hypothetical protein